MNLPSGFGTYSGPSQTISNFTSDLLLKSAQINGLIVLPITGHIGVYGYMQYWNYSRIGHLIIFDSDSGKVNTYGSILGGTGIDKVYLLKSGNLLVFGDINLYSQPEADLGNIAVCTRDPLSCYNLGNGLESYRVLISAIDIKDSYYVAYESDESTFNVAVWNGAFTGWEIILKISKKLEYDLFSMDIFNNTIYIAGTFSITEENYGCGTAGSQVFAYWNSECWAQANSGQAEFGIWREIRHSDGLLYGIGFFKDTLGFFNGTGWTPLPSTSQYCDVNNYTIWKLEPIEGGVLLKCDKNLVRYNLSSNSWIPLTPVQLCTDYAFYPDTTQLVVFRGDIWYFCPSPATSTNSFQLSKYSVSNNNVTIYNPISPLNNPGDVYQICTVGSSFIFLIGDFQQIGSLFANSTAMWSGNQWSTIVFSEQVAVLGPTDFLCASNGTRMITTYRTIGGGVGIASAIISDKPPVWTVYPPFNISNGFSVFSIGPATPVVMLDVVYIVYASEFANNTVSGILAFNFTDSTWTKPPTFQFNNQGLSVLCMASDFPHLYIGGRFQLNITQNPSITENNSENTSNANNSSISFSNVAKYNVISQTWEYMDPVRLAKSARGVVKALEIVHDEESNCIWLYVGGAFEMAGSLQVNNLACANATSGIFTSTLSQGLSNNIVSQLVFDEPSNTLFIVNREQTCSPYASCTYLSFYLKGVLYKSVHLAEAITIISTPVNYFITALGIGLSITGLLTVAILVVHFVVKDKPNNYIQIPTFESGVSDGIETLLKDVNINKIERLDIVQGDIIGVGGQAVVRAGFYKGNPVAIKTIHRLNLQTEMITFLQEIQLMRFEPFFLLFVK